MRKHILPASESRTTVLHATPHRAPPDTRHHRLRVRDATRTAFWSAALLSSAALLASSPASAQFACTTTATDITCNNAGTQSTPFINTAGGANQNATTTNSGTADGFESETTAGGNATATNSGTNNGAAGFNLVAVAVNGGNAAATNTGNNAGEIGVETEGRGQCNGEQFRQ
jgi:hypothetical protein